MTHEGRTWDLVGAAYVLDGYVSDVPLRFVNGWTQLEDALYVDVRAYGEATGRRGTRSTRR